VVSVPGFLLRRLYVKGSLQNTGTGFQFELKNMLGSGYARRMLPLTLDGEQVGMDQTQFTAAGTTTSFASVSEETPFTLAMNAITLITISGVPLSVGPHKITMGFEVPGLGTLSFDITDVVSYDK